MTLSHFPPAGLAFFYILVGFVHLAATIRNRGCLRSWTKVLLMPLLAGWVWMTGGGTAGSLAVALLAAWVGDVLLLRKDRMARLIGGMAAFLAMHLLYISRFVTIVPAGAAGSAWLVAVPVMAGVGVLLFRRLGPGLEKLKLPVLVYLGTISVMVTVAVRLASATGGEGWAVAAGAVLFMISDSLLALRLFAGGSDRLAGWVTASYLSAQWLIAWGLLSAAQGVAV